MYKLSQTTINISQSSEFSTHISTPQDIAKGDYKFRALNLGLLSLVKNLLCWDRFFPKLAFYKQALNK